MPNADVRGTFIWHELMTTDTKAAAAFYPRLIDWKPQPWEQNPSYSIWESKQGSMGGLMTLPEEAKAQGARPQWVTYIGTPDVAATVEAAQKLGARVLKDTTEISVGKFAILADPQGVSFGVFTPSAPPPQSSEEIALGNFAWHELATSDREGALRFYSELFGWEKSDGHDMGPPVGVYQLFSRGGRDIGGIYQFPIDMPMPSRWLPYVMVKDINEATDAAKAAGGQIVHGPMQVPGGGWIAQIVDPQGAMFAIFEEERAAAAKKAPAARSSAAKASGRKPPASGQPEAARPATAAAQTAPPAKRKAGTTKPAKAAGKKVATKKAAAKKAPARKAAARKAPAKKTAAKKAPAKRVAARKTASKKAAARRPAAKSTGRRVAARKGAARNAAARKSAGRSGRKVVARKAPARTKVAARRGRGKVATRSMAKKRTGRGRR